MVLVEYFVPVSLLKTACHRTEKILTFSWAGGATSETCSNFATISAMKRATQEFIFVCNRSESATTIYKLPTIYNHFLESDILLK